MKRILLVILGFLCTFSGVEICLRLIKGNPPELNYSQEFEYGYLDIHKDFFKPYPEKGIYKPIRHLSNKSEFAIKKTDNIRRVFIIGESVAHEMDSNRLANRLKKAFPGYKWEIINCGMPAYDSYRIKLIMKKIVNHFPDLIILLMGNNEGSHDPIKINSWIYRYRFLASFHITRLITGLLNPAKKRVDEDINKNFNRNLLHMINISAKKKIPILLCTLPQIHYAPRYYDFPYHDKNMFSFWWILQKKPSHARHLIKDKITQKYYWYIARSLEKSGDQEEADHWYRKNRPYSQTERNNIIRDSVDNSYSVLVDFDKIIMQLSGHKPGFELFWDVVHYWPLVYHILNEEILKQIINNGLLELSPDFEQYEYAAVEFYDAIIRENSKHFANYRGFKIFFQKAHKLLFSHTDKSYELLREYIRFAYKKNNALILDFKNNYQDILTDIDSDSLFHKISDEKLAHIFCIIGDVLREEGRFIEALSYFNSALRVGSKNIRKHVFFFRGLCYFDMNSIDFADTDFNKLKQLDPRFFWISRKYLENLTEKYSD